jgi:hypothetical protein
MIFVSATRLKVKSIFTLPAFMKANEGAVKELVKIPGFLGGAELVDKGMVFRTLTMWKDDVAMKTFRNGDAHRKAMQKLPDWCDEAAYMHWMQEETVLPDWNTIHEKIVSEGKLTKVRKPSKRQESKNYPPVKWSKIQRPLKPQSK